MSTLIPTPDPQAPEMPKLKTPYPVLFALDAFHERMILLDMPCEIDAYLTEMGCDPEDIFQRPDDMETGIYRAVATFHAKRGDGWETEDDTWFELEDVLKVEVPK